MLKTYIAIGKGILMELEYETIRTNSKFATVILAPGAVFQPTDA
jgi:hypothetical protein